MTGFTKISALAAAVATVVSGMASAQTGPATSGARPMVTSPYWDSANHNGIATPSGVTTYDEAGKLLSQTVQAVPQAAADMSVAQWTYYKLNSDLTQASNHLRDDFRNSDEYTNATNEFNSAYGEYAAARQDAIKGIQSSDDYHAAMDLRKSISDQITDAAGRDPKKVDTDRLASLAALKLEYITPVRTVERELIAASPRVAAARDRLMKAAHEVARLEKAFAKDARDSIELADIRKNRASARIAYLASWAYLQEARVARRVAFVYATNNQFGGNNGGLSPAAFDDYGYGGYGGYGYGGGFGYGTNAGIGYLGGSYANGSGGGNIGGMSRGGSNGFSAGFVNGGTGYSPGFANGATNGFSPGR